MRPSALAERDRGGDTRPQMRTPTPADFLERAKLAELRAARATNAALREALLKVAAAWRRLIPAPYA